MTMTRWATSARNRHGTSAAAAAIGPVPGNAPPPSRRPPRPSPSPGNARRSAGGASCALRCDVTPR